MHPSLPFLSLGSLASPPTGFSTLSSFKSACVDVSPPYPALRDTSRLAICTVGKPPSFVNARSQFRVIGEVVTLVAVLSGIALSPELLGQNGRRSNNRDPVSVPRVRTSWSSASAPSPASHVLDPLAPYCYT